MTSSLKNTLQRLYDRLDAGPGGALWTFLLKQAWAALFGGLLLIAIMVTAYVPLPWMSRYDWLLIIAIGIQAMMLWTRLERPYEAITIAAFHLVGLAMEAFKTSGDIGSWTYPDDSIFRVGNVPLFSGFMYAAVGSYIARAWRVLELRFTHYPPPWATCVLAAAIYINFFSHHYIIDIRNVLFIAMFGLYFRTFVHYRLNQRQRKMPLLVGFGLIAAVIWLAENAATFFSIWYYPDQVGAWRPVSLSKFGSWYLLIVISYVLVDMLHRWYRARGLSPEKPITRSTPS